MDSGIEKYQERQVRQAQTAVSLYHTYLESLDKGKSKEDISAQDFRKLVYRNILNIAIDNLYGIIL